MKGLSKKLIGLGSLGLTAVSAFAATTGSSATIPMPSPNYTDFFAGVGVVLGVTLTVMLAKRLKHFFR